MRHLTRHATVLALLLALAALPAPPAAAGDGSDAAGAFAALKGLEGTWQSTSASGEQGSLEYEVVAGGSAVVETFVSPQHGEENAMVTVYHLDGDDLVLTHYCMAGNQPTMRAAAIDGDEVRFELDHVSNLASPGAGHMARAVFRFQGPDRYTSAWTFRQGGEDAYTEVFEVERLSAAPAAASSADRR